jgi:CRISPR-associated protein Cmx8
VEVEPLETRVVQREERLKGGSVKLKDVTVHIYPQVEPQGALLAESVPRGEGGERWIKLWRDMLYAIVRGIPTQRGPYERRAAKLSCGEGEAAWALLSGKKADASLSLASTMYLGAQSVTAENVGFKDTAKQMFLLHFWPLVAQIYVPATLARLKDGWRTQYEPYVLAIPDICDLEGFCKVYMKYLPERSVEVRGYLPAAAVVDLPAEGGLALMSALIAESSKTQRLNLLGVEVIYAKKEGNSVNIRDFKRIDPGGLMLRRYNNIKSNYKDINVRRLLIENLIEGRPWITGFGRFLSVQSTDLTIGRGLFQHDARLLCTQLEESMSDNSDDLKTAIWWTVKNWLHARVVKRKPEFKSRDDVKSSADKMEYNKQTSKAAMEAFYAARSRTGRDFADYFTTTLCAVPQSMQQSRYMELSAKLLDDSGCEDVRALTLLALSALGGGPFHDVKKADAEAPQDNNPSSEE